MQFWPIYFWLADMFPKTLKQTYLVSVVSIFKQRSVQLYMRQRQTVNPQSIHHPNTLISQLVCKHERSAMRFRMLVRSFEMAHILSCHVGMYFHPWPLSRKVRSSETHGSAFIYIYIEQWPPWPPQWNIAAAAVRHCAITRRHKSNGVRLDSSSLTESSGLFFVVFCPPSAGRNDFIRWGDGASPSRGGLCSDRFPLLLNYRSQIDDGAADASKMFAWCCNTLRPPLLATRHHHLMIMNSVAASHQLQTWLQQDQRISTLHFHWLLACMMATCFLFSFSGTWTTWLPCWLVWDNHSFPPVWLILLFGSSRKFVIVCDFDFTRLCSLPKRHTLKCFYHKVEVNSATCYYYV